VNETPGSRFFGRFVVGKFRAHEGMIDPFEIAVAYVDQACPRDLTGLLADIEVGMAGPRAGLH